MLLNLSLAMEFLRNVFTNNFFEKSLARSAGDEKSYSYQ